MGNYFISIGGGNEIGASCYFLQCEGRNFLLDAGIRYVKRQRYPSFSELVRLPTFDNLNDFNGIFLSHAHYDHNGALPLLATKLTENKEIICSQYTKYFTEVQLDILKKHKGIENYSIYEDVMVDKVINMLSVYPVEKRIEKKEYSFTFYKAGHIPGAVMTYLEVDEKKILYTGDFSDKDYPLVPKYKLPSLSDLDLLIINSTSVFKKNDNWDQTWGNKSDGLNRILKEILLYNQLNVNISHVSMGLELLILLDEELKKSSFSRLGISLYIDEPVHNMLSIIKRVENKSFENIHLMGKNFTPNSDTRCIYITLRNKPELGKIKQVTFNYSLHESYEGIKDLILKLNPKKTLIVHYSEQENGEEYLMKDLEKKGYYNCEYVKNEELYEF